MCLFCLGTAGRELKSDNLAGMREHTRQGLTLAKQCGHRRMEMIANMCIGQTLWCMGAPIEAERMLQDLPLSDVEFGPTSAYRPFMLAWMHAERGALGEARTHADHLAFTLGRDRGLPLDEGRGRWVLAEVLRRAGALEEAEREVEGAWRLLSLTCPVELSGVLATKAALKLQQGKPDEALAAAEEGLSRQAAMQMHDHSKIDDPAYQKSFLENVPENRRTLELARQWLGG
jgi:hypothetical protein